MDPLQILRDYSLKGELDRVVIDGEQIQFGDQYAFPKNAKTAYKSKRGEGDFYSLHTVLFALQNKDLMLKNFSNYLPECNNKGVPSVAFVDRKDLMQHLTETGFASKNVETVAPPLEVPLAVEKQTGDQSQAATAKAAVAEGDTGGDGGETLALKQILHRERQLHDRNTMLICGRRDFSSVLNILQHATKQATKAHPRHGSRPAAAPPPPQKPPQQQQQQQQMNLNMPQRGGRYDQTSQQAWKGELGQDAQALQEFGISTEGGFMRKKRKAGEGEPGPKPAAPSHRAAPPGGSQRPKPPPPPAAKPRAPPRADPRAAARPKARGTAGGVPIIIVPSGFGSLLNLYNARQFLEDGAYVSWKILKEEGHRPGKMVKMVRKFGRDKPPFPEYHLLDKPPPDPKSPDWQRVVAVIVVGKAWQFKGWPFKGANEGDLVETFDRVMGFHVQFLDEPPNEAVAKWKVHRYTLDRNHRHFDSAVAREIWKVIDHGLASRKSTLNY